MTSSDFDDRGAKAKVTIEIELQQNILLKIHQHKTVNALKPQLRTWSVSWREGVSTLEQTTGWTCLVGIKHPLGSSHLAICKLNLKMINQTLKSDPQKKIFFLDERLLIICWPSNGINKMAGTHPRFFPTKIWKSTPLPQAFTTVSESIWLSFDTKSTLSSYIVPFYQDFS